MNSSKEVQSTLSLSHAQRVLASYSVCEPSELREKIAQIVVALRDAEALEVETVGRWQRFPKEGKQKLTVWKNGEEKPFVILSKALIGAERKTIRVSGEHALSLAARMEMGTLKIFLWSTFRMKDSLEKELSHCQARAISKIYREHKEQLSVILHPNFLVDEYETSRKEKKMGIMLDYHGEDWLSGLRECSLEKRLEICLEAMKGLKLLHQSGLILADLIPQENHLNDREDRLAHDLYLMGDEILRHVLKICPQKFENICLASCGVQIVVQDIDSPRAFDSEDDVRVSHSQLLSHVLMMVHRDETKRPKAIDMTIAALEMCIKSKDECAFLATQERN